MVNLEKLKKIKLLILDVDGVLTDTRIFLGSDGEWKRFFSIRDGVGIKELQKKGYKTAVITGSKAQDITQRVKNLGITYFYDGYLEKEPALNSLLSESKLSLEEMAFIGDDIYDLPILKQVGFAATVPDAVEEVKKEVDYITCRPGGLGAAREICDYIIKHGFYSSSLR